MRDDGVTPEYCGKCRVLNLPCAQGLVGENGRRCPQVEHACRTVEGEAVWQSVAQSGCWSGGGMMPRRVDRSAVRARLSNVDGWIVETLIDAFEPTALAAAAKADAARKPKTPERRRAQRPPPPEGESE